MLPLYRSEFKAMGSACELVFADEDQAAALQKMQLAHAEVMRIERKYSRYLPDSVVSRINQQAGLDWVDCDKETESLLNYAHSLFVLSEGLFDITSGILRRGWDFQQHTVPDASQLSHLLFFVGWQKVAREAGKIRLPLMGMEIDFGGFGKEYAVDRVATLLAEAGVTHGYVNLGGDLRVLGPKPDGTPWLLGIQHPRQAQTLVANLPLTQGALATSGDYERYFEKDGQRYCHILSPQNGMPVTHWQSITVLAPLAITAGTYTTIAMLKQDQALPWLAQSGYAYLAIDSEGTLHQHNAVAETASSL